MVFDSKYLHVTNGTTITRYNTSLSFTSSGSYELYNCTTVTSVVAIGYSTFIYDGRYLYYPGSVGILRYDTQQSFTNVASYTYVTTTSLFGSSISLLGGVFDGRYVFFLLLMLLEKLLCMIQLNHFQRFHLSLHLIWQQFIVIYLRCKMVYMMVRMSILHLKVTNIL